MAPTLVPKAVLFTLLMAGLVLAGCSGGSDDADADADDVSASDTPIGEDVGVIAGSVVNEELLPVPGADVAIIQADMLAKTDDEGKFLLEGVPIGSQVVHVQKLGYEAATVRVTVEAGQTATPQLTLTAIEVKEPYTDYQEGSGKLFCSYYALVSWSSCPMASTLGEHDHCQEFTVTPGVTWRQGELVWLQNNQLAPDRLWFGEANAHGSGWWATAQGESPVVVQSGDDDEEFDFDDEEELTSQWCAYIASSTTPNVAFDQDYTVYFTGFYHFDEVPDGWQARPA